MSAPAAPLRGNPPAFTRKGDSGAMSQLPANRPPPRAVTGQIITPDKMASAKAAAERVRTEIHQEGFKAGKHEGLKLAGRYRDGALVAIGFVVGLMAGGVFAWSLAERGMYTAAAITDRTLARTVPAPEEVLPPAPAVRPVDEVYEQNAARARGGCSDEQLRAGLRRCGVEPGAPAPRRP